MIWGSPDQILINLLHNLLVETETLSEEDVKEVKDDNLYYGNIPHGKKFPMFGVSRNNVSESVANVSKEKI